jgi:hypothetical protein
MSGIIIVLYGAVVILTLILTALWRVKPQEQELFRIKETPLTAVFGFLLWAECGIIMYYNLTSPEHLGTGQNVQINAWIFIAVSALLGSGVILYYFVKTIIVKEDGFIYVSILGKSTEMKWNDVHEVSRIHTKRIILKTRGGIKITIGGDIKNYKKFVSLASQKTNPEIGRDVFKTIKIK